LFTYIIPSWNSTVDLKMQILNLENKLMIKNIFKNYHLCGS
jgi:hypothetical protein